MSEPWSYKEFQESVQRGMERAALGEIVRRDGWLEGVDDDVPTLTDFLLARIAEDERDARNAYPSGDWQIDTSKKQLAVTGSISAQDAPWRFARVSEGCTAQHIARHDPARVLAECEAKRRIITRLTEIAAGESSDQWNAADDALVDGLRILASVYADHPDYPEEWKL